MMTMIIRCFVAFANGLRCYYSPWSRYPFNPGYATIVTTTNRYCAVSRFDFVYGSSFLLLTLEKKLLF